MDYEKLIAYASSFAEQAQMVMDLNNFEFKNLINIFTINRVAHQYDVDHNQATMICADAGILPLIHEFMTNLEEKIQSIPMSKAASTTKIAR